MNLFLRMRTPEGPYANLLSLPLFCFLVLAYVCHRWCGRRHCVIEATPDPLSCCNNDAERFNRCVNWKICVSHRSKWSGWDFSDLDFCAKMWKAVILLCVLPYSYGESETEIPRWAQTEMFPNANVETLASIKLCFIGWPILVSKQSQ